MVRHSALSTTGWVVRHSTNSTTGWVVRHSTISTTGWVERHSTKSTTGWVVRHSTNSTTGWVIRHSTNSTTGCGKHGLLILLLAELLLMRFTADDVRTYISARKIIVYKFNNKIKINLAV